MHIHTATSHDAESISALIRSVAHYFTLHPQGLGAEEILKTLTGEAIDGLIHAAHFRYFARFTTLCRKSIAQIAAKVGGIEGEFVVSRFKTYNKR